MENQKKKTTHILFHGILSVLMIAQIILFIIYFNHGKIPSLKIIGIGLWILSAILGWIPIYIFRKRGGIPQGESYVKTTKLVDASIYSMVRHPQFLAGMFLSLAFILISQHWLVLIFGIPVIIIFYMGGLEEDSSGIEKFGKEYEEYMMKVPRFNIILGIIRKLGKT
jgi:protein-S-isoprenylcysteine O-methyltransferase Ste14